MPLLTWVLKTDTLYNSHAMNKTLPHLKEKRYGGAWSIYDEESLNFRLQQKHIQGDPIEFLNDYKDWINQKDFDLFPHLSFSQGTTETFDKFYLKHHTRRLRILKGEYFYHQIASRNYFSGVTWIDEEPLEVNDVVIMSCPFSDTGNIPVGFYNILGKCDEKKIPVLLDLAYINLTDLQLNLNFDCIETVTTSMSKVFPLEYDRIGIRLDKTLYDDTMVAYNQNKYINLYSIGYGQQFIGKFDNKWLLNKYRSKQKKMCDELDVEPSSSVIFGIDTKNLYDEYNRGGNTNRLCFSKIWDNRVK